MNTSAGRLQINDGDGTSGVVISWPAIAMMTTAKETGKEEGDDGYMEASQRNECFDSTNSRPTGAWNASVSSVRTRVSING